MEAEDRSDATAISRMMISMSLLTVRYDERTRTVAGPDVAASEGSPTRGVMSTLSTVNAEI